MSMSICTAHACIRAKQHEMQLEFHPPPTIPRTSITAKTKSYANTSSTTHFQFVNMLLLILQKYGHIYTSILDISKCFVNASLPT